MKLHLPHSLRKSVLVCMMALSSLVTTLASGTMGVTAASLAFTVGRATAETTSVTISASDDNQLTTTPADSLIIMNLNRGNLYGSTTLNSSFDVLADVQIDSLIISDGYRLTTYNFSGDISGAGTFERTSDAKGANQTYVFTGDMSAYSGAMKFSRENDGNTFKFIGNKSGTGTITIAAGNTLVVDGATMNNSAIDATYMTISGASSFVGDVTVSTLLSIGANTAITLGADASLTLGEGALIDLANATYTEDAVGNRTYSIFAAGSTGTHNLADLTAAMIKDAAVGYGYSFNQNGTIVTTRLGRDVSYAGGTLSWSTAADNKSFTQGSAAVSFEQGDNVTFAGDSQVTLAEDIQATRVIVGREAEVAVHTAGHALAADIVEVEGSLRYQLGGENLSILDLKGAGTLVLDNADVDSAASFSIGGDVSAFTGELTVQGNTTLALQGKANGLVSASEASVTIGDGAVLKVENIAGWHTIWRLNLKDGSLTLNADLSISSLDYSGGNLNANGYNLTITDSLTVRKQLIINGSQNGAFPLNGLKTLSFINSTADSLGGAIYGGGSSTITLSNNGSVTFSGNTASGSSYVMGGAIYGTITLSNNGSVTFSGNTASGSSAYGGAIYGGTITLSNNESVTFSGNTSSSSGGAIDGYGSITIDNNGSVTFSGNTSSSFGGAIDGSVTMTGNESVTFSGNTASSTGEDSFAYGGAIDGSVTMTGNESVTFTGNTASASYSNGGAISVRGNDNECINNKSVVFTSNKAAIGGGAVYVRNGSLVLSYNEEVEFCCNEAFSAASYSNTGGGAIHGDNSTLNLSNNGSVAFRENMTSHLGGAIRIDGDLYIQNNDSVLFERNLQKYRGEYCLSGIYAAGGSGKTVSLSAAEGGSIEFHEGIYVGAGSTVNLNADYGVTQQMGDIVFTGAFAATHLNDMISALEPGRVATQEEILTSCTTEVLALTNLYGGCLRVEDGAVYKGKGITVHEGSGAVVRVQNADLDHDSDLLTFNSGTSLELAGNNNIIGNVQLLSGGSLLLDSSAERGETTIAGRLQFSDDCSFTLNAGGSAYGKNEFLMSVSASVSGWSDVQQILPDGMTLTWVDNLLILNYDAASFNRFINGSASFDSQQIGHLSFLHYENLDFAGINGSAGGGALQGNMVVSHNGRVSFLGNAAPRGGAIKGENIMLDQNENLIFSENIATGGTGGALHGQSIVINGNQKALFEKNAEIAADGYRLRGIWAANELELTAGENDEIRLHDSSYAGQTVEININTENRPAGLVVLDGSHVAEHLAEVKGTPASEKEILLSRVHEWKAATLHAGTLQVSGGARLLADSFTVGAGSALVLDGGLLCAGTLNLEPNAILHLKDKSFVLANFAPAEDTAEKTISLHDLSAGASIRMEGDMDFSGVTFLIADENLADGTYRLLELEHTSTVAWNPSRVTVTGVDADKASLVWNDGCLYLNYGATPGVQELVEYDQDGRILVQRDTYVCAAAQLQDSALCGSRNFLLQNHVEVSGSGLDLLAGFAREYSFGSADAENRSSLTFSNIKGNAIRLDKGADFISLKGLKDILFEANVFSADEYKGGAIRGVDNCTILIEDNNDVSFISNSGPGPYYCGGAISLGSDSELKLRGNRSVSFINNYLPSGNYGGAIEGYVRCDIVISDNDGVLFSENSLCSTYFAGGGAISLRSDSSLSLHKNKSVIFSKNAVLSSSAWEGIIIGGGGAIEVSGTLSITENANILFSENVVSSPNVGEHEALKGAAISCYGDLNIRNNGSCLFEKNVEVNQEGYRLRSIYTNGDVISLSAAEGKSIEFRDSIYIGSGSTVEFNADYTDSAGVVHAQKGDIIFTGAYTEAHLNELLADAGAGRVATAEEIRLSRRSEVLAMTNLYGGRLRVEDGAIYRGSGITAMEGSNATVRVKDATLNHSGYDLIFNAGTTLEIGGISEINGDIELLSGSMLTLWESSTMKLSEDSLLKAETGSRIHLENNATLDLAGELEAGESVMVELSKGAAVSRDGIAISNMGATDVALLDAVSFAAGSMQKVENMHVVIDNNENTNIDYQLVNSSVENRGSGKLTVTHAQNSITAVRSEGGAIDILNVDTSDAGTVLKLATLELHGGATLGVYTGDTVDAAQEAWVQVSGSAVFGKGTTINADLELMEGCSLTLGGTVDMGSDLRINGTLTLDGELLAQIQAAEIGASFDLFTGIDNLYLSGVQYDSIALSDNMHASTYFVGLEDSLEAERGYRLTYASATPGEGVLSVHVVTIPEPTTATLSFLALAGLMLRRRHK